METHSYSCGARTIRKLSEIGDKRKADYPKESVQYYSRSCIIRDAVDLLHRYEVKGESILNDDDPRYSQ